MTTMHIHRLSPVFNTNELRATRAGQAFLTHAWIGNIHIKSTFPTRTQFGDARISPTFFNDKSPAFHRLVRDMLGDKADRLGVLPLYAEQAIAVLAEVFIGTEVRAYLP